MPISLFGDVDLDLSKAALASDTVTVTAVTPFGDVEVLVPAGVEVDVGGFTFFGNKRVRVDEAATGSAPIVKVRAYTIFGNVRVRSV